MLEWFVSNIGTIAVAFVVAAVVALIIIKKVIDRRKGKSSCSCGCSNCPMSGKCGHH